MDGLGAAILVAVTLGFILFSFVFAKRLATRLTHGSPAKQAEAQRLMATGHKARATLLSIDPTGTILNHINIQCRVAFRMEPLDGSTGFDGEKTFYINQTKMPRVGDVWPCWYDPQDRSKFGVGQPDLASADAQQTLEDFGIANPLVASGGGGEPEASDASDGGDDDDRRRLDAIEQLGDLRNRGLLSDVEFNAEKKRILDD